MLCYLITMIFDPLLSLRLLAQSRALFRISVEIELGLDLLSHANGRITFVQTAHLSAGKRFWLLNAYITRMLTQAMI